MSVNIEIECEDGYDAKRFERGEKFLRKYIPEGIQAALDFDGPQKVKDYFTLEDNEGIVSALKGVK